MVKMLCRRIHKTNIAKIFEGTLYFIRKPVIYVKLNLTIVANLFQIKALLTFSHGKWGKVVYSHRR